VIPDDPASIDSEFLAISFASAREYLKERRVQYVFQKRRSKPEEWEISTWSKHVQRSEIEKHGTEQDKANLPEANRFNGSRVQRNKRKRGPTDDRQRKVARKRGEQRPQARANDTQNGTVEGEFQAAFGNAADAVETTQRMQALDARIQQHLRQESRNHEAERLSLRSRVGDAVSADGSLLFVQERPPSYGLFVQEGPPSYGQLTGGTRQQQDAQRIRDVECFEVESTEEGRDTREMQVIDISSTEEEDSQSTDEGESPEIRDLVVLKNVPFTSKNFVSGKASVFSNMKTLLEDITSKPSPEICAELARIQRERGPINLANPDDGADIIGSFGNEEIKYRSIYRIYCGEWLDDLAMNVFFKMMGAREALMDKEHGVTRPNRNLFFPCQFVRKLRERGSYNFSYVAKWTRKLSTDVFQYQKLFFTVDVTDIHWFLVVVDNEKKQYHVMIRCMRVAVSTWRISDIIFLTNMKGFLGNKSVGYITERMATPSFQVRQMVVAAAYTHASMQTGYLRGWGLKRYNQYMGHVHTDCTCCHCFTHS
jgi:hypothetical protein